MGAPGVYITAKTAQAEQGRIRTDIGALLGYAQKGPTTVAVAISSFVQFAQVFGDERSGYLTGSAQSFFDNGGTDLYVIRVNSKTGMTASVSLPMLNEDQCQHRFSCYAAAPAYTGPGNAKQMKAVRKYDTVDVVGTQRFYRMKSPGLWGNDLSINVTLSAPGVYKVVQWEPARSVLRLSSVANLEAGSLLDIEPLLTDTINQWSRVVSVDKASKEVTLTQDSVDRIDHEKAAQSLTIYSTVLRLRVYYKQQLVEEFQRLGLHPDHRRYFVELVNQTSDWLAFESLLEKSTEANITTKEDWQWLNCLQGDYPLKDGLGQLAGIGQSDFAAAIDAVELEPAIGLLAAPDIVYRQTGEVQQSPAIIEDDTCTYPPIHPKGDMIGTVLNQLDDSPIINARAIIATSSTPGLTLERRCDNNGQFTVIGVPIGTATVSIEASGYVFEDFVVTIEGQPFTANGEFSMTPIEQPPVFDNEQILFLQQRLIEQAETLRRHYVLLDPPASESQLSELTDWRYQYDSRLASLIYPWLTFDALEQ
ncbi:MAG: hypothetical protein HRT35_18555, partial [Algicola sp.]|nr:hypothetical protein [Algicola sp.]